MAFKVHVNRASTLYSCLIWFALNYRREKQIFSHIIRVPMSNKPNHKSKPSIIETYDAIAEHFDITRYKPWPETIKFADKLEPGSVVLDMGCGNGRNLRFMVSKGMRVLGIDISTGQLELARTRTMREYPDLCENYYFAVGDVGPCSPHLSLNNPIVPINCL